MFAALVWPIRALARAGQCSACTTAEAVRWDEVRLSSATTSEALSTSASSSLAQGESVIIIPDVASDLECETLRAAGVTAADAQREIRVLAGLKDPALGAAPQGSNQTQPVHIARCW